MGHHINARAAKMNIDEQAAADAIMSARHSDAFDREACVKIIHELVEKAVSASRESDIKKFLPMVKAEIAAQPKPELLAIIRRGEGMKRLLGLYIGNDKRPLLREGQKVSESDLERILAAIKRSHAAQPQRIEGTEAENIGCPSKWPKGFVPKWKDGTYRWTRDMDATEKIWLNEMSEPIMSAKPLRKASLNRHHYDAPDGCPCSCQKPIDDPIHIRRTEP